MLKLPKLENVTEPPAKKMSFEEYCRFCEFFLKSNPHITPKNCLSRKTGEEDIQIPFRL